MLPRAVVFVYGVGGYLAAVAALIYAVGFLANLGVPHSLDSPPRVPAGRAVAIDTLLMAVFATQHTIMARGWFKRAWNRALPEIAARSTYVLMASIALLVLLLLWEPLGGVVWSTGNPVLRLLLGVLRTAGWLLLAVSTFLISHFDIFGVRQVWLYLRGLPYTPLRFRTPLFYRYVRHPLYLGWLLMIWATPAMTASRLLFAILTTAYLLIGIRFEERELIRIHGEAYLTYRDRVPMVFPFTSRRPTSP